MEKNGGFFCLRAFFQKLRLGFQTDYRKSRKSPEKKRISLFPLFPVSHCAEIDFFFGATTWGGESAFLRQSAAGKGTIPLFDSFFLFPEKKMDFFSSAFHFANGATRRFPPPPFLPSALLTGA